MDADAETFRHQRNLLAEAIVRIAEALGAEVGVNLTGPEVLLLAQDTEGEARTISTEADDLRSELADARQRLVAVKALRDDLAKLSGWVGPWVHSLNVLDRLNEILADTAGTADIEGGVPE